MAPKTLPHDHGNNSARWINDLPAVETFQTMADVFKLLDDSSRLKIFWFLCHSEECVINLAVIVNMSSPAVSHHLKQLKANKLVVSRRDGKEMYYKAADTEQVKLLHQMIEKLVKITCLSD